MLQKFSREKGKSIMIDEASNIIDTGINSNRIRIVYSYIMCKILLSIYSLFF